jgi:hypothetical protein
MTNGQNAPRTDEPKPADETPTGRTPSDAEFSVAFSPRQIAGGFAILAALLVLLVRRRRKKG